MEYHKFNRTFVSPTLESIIDNDKDDTGEVGGSCKTESESCEGTNEPNTYSNTSSDGATNDGDSEQQHSEHNDDSDICTVTISAQNSQSSPQKLSRQRPGSVMLRSLIFHIPEMNLPWHPTRNITQCPCGTAFTFTQRKVLCLLLK